MKDNEEKREAKIGRPPAIIDWKVVNTYLQAQCTGTAIASLLGIHADTLYHACEDQYKMSFSAYSQIKKAEGLELLRANQFKSAMSGNTVMQIWLGKQLLGQKDKTSLEGGDIPLQVDIKVTSKENAKKLKDFLNGSESK